MSGDRAPEVAWGACGPPEEPVQLYAGTLTGELLGSEIRNLCVAGHQVLQSVYVAARDQDWGTVPPRITSKEIRVLADGFEVAIEVEHVQGEFDFAWQGIIAASLTGTFKFEVRGRARSEFKRNRLGLCLLHGLGMVGRPVGLQRVEDHDFYATVFPRAISPSQPFLGVQGFKHEWDDGTSASLRLTGDEFETEDQRNWSDASFKTYSTPLRLPFPVLVRAGDTVRQSLHVRFGNAKGHAASAIRANQRHPDRDVTIGKTRRSFPTIGTTLRPGRACLSERAAARLRRLNLGHVRALITPEHPFWQGELEQRAQDAKAIAAELELEIVTDDAATASCVAEQLRRYDAARCLVFSRARHVSTVDLLRTYARAVKQASPGVAVGGGSRAYFAEFNRAELPLEHMEIAAFALSPQVHRTETFALIENLETQASMVASARTIIGSRDLVVGPVTLLPRYNPNATSTAGSPPTEQLAGDLRQESLFCAAWTLGSIAELGLAGTDGITYFDATGPQGILPHPMVEAPPPLYHLLERLGRARPDLLYTVQLADRQRTQALAVASATERTVFVTNLATRELTVQVGIPWRTEQVTVEVMDETSIGTKTPWALRGTCSSVQGEVSISLRPCAVAAIVSTIH